MGTARDENIGLDVAERICERYGFSAEERKSTGVFVRVMDAQHAVTISLVPWQKAPPKGGSQVSVSFGVSRRDITDLREELFDDVVSQWWWTVTEPPRFFDQPFGNWASTAERSQITEWVDLWVPRLIEEAPLLSFIEQWWHRTVAPREDGSSANWDSRTDVGRLCNQLLWGLTPEAEEELLVPFEQLIEQIGPDDKYKRHDKMVAQAARIRAWLADHPNGIERELVDWRA